MIPVHLAASKAAASTMFFLPDAASLITFTAASVILFITPGPDMSLFLARTLEGGKKAGFASCLGANLGCVAHTLLAAFGISALLAASTTAFLALKIIGAGYLLWLAFAAIRKGSALNVQVLPNRKPPSLKATFLTGVMVNLTNPKVVLFFITFLPQFVRAGDPHVAAKLVFLGLYFVAVNIPLTIAMIMGAEKLVGWLRVKPGVMRTIDYCFAGVFGLFAVRIALAQGR